jgi:hypothetical protein
MRPLLLSCAIGMSGALAAGCYLDATDPALEDATAVDAATDATFAVEETNKAISVLRDLEQRLPGLLVDGKFPSGIMGFTPAATCCGAGGVRSCPANVADWIGRPMWAELDFVIDGPHAHVYMATSSGADLRVTAHADTDCDGSFADVNLVCAAPLGVVDCRLDLPRFLE